MVLIKNFLHRLNNKLTSSENGLQTTESGPGRDGVGGDCGGGTRQVEEAI